MKKFFHSLLLLAVASMTMTAFVSCETDDDDIVKKEEEVKQEEYLALSYWISDDVLEIADVKVTGASAMKFSTSLKIDGCPGKVCDLVELTGQKAKDADIKVTVELKSNWKELIKGKEVFNLADYYLVSHDKNQSIEFKNVVLNISVLDNDNHAGVTMEQGIETLVPGLGFEYKAGK